MMAALMLLSGAAAWPQPQASFPSECSEGSVATGRTTHLLSGDWDFVFLQNYNVSTTTTLQGVVYNRTQTVPGAWDAAWGTGLQYTRGVGVYRAQVTTSAVGGPLALHFAACSLFCRVYVDGELRHNHTLGGFTPFSVEVPPSSKRTREIVVLASNVFSDDFTPTQYQNYDFYQYGGLLRPVCLHELPPKGPSLERVEVKPLANSASKPSGDVNITVALRGAAEARAAGDGGSVTLEFEWDCVTRECGTGFKGTFPVVNGKIFIPASVPNPRIWQPVANSPSTPRLDLHNLTVRILMASGEPSDALTVRFGLRIVSTSGRNILLNGAPLKLKGFNRHDMYPQLGPSLPLERYQADLDEVHKLNANFIRGCRTPRGTPNQQSR